LYTIFFVLYTFKCVHVVTKSDTGKSNLKVAASIPEKRPDSTSKGAKASASLGRDVGTPSEHTVSELRSAMGSVRSQKGDNQLVARDLHEVFKCVVERLRSALEMSKYRSHLETYTLFHLVELTPQERTKYKKWLPTLEDQDFYYFALFETEALKKRNGALFRYNINNVIDDN